MSRRKILLSWSGRGREPYTFRSGRSEPGAHLQLLRDSEYAGFFDQHLLLAVPETLADERDWFGEHREFLRVALQKEVFAKLVLPGAPDLSQVERAARMVADVARDRVALILQPVTPFGQITAAPTASDISRAYEVARRLLREVRVIPQTHKMIGLR